MLCFRWRELLETGDFTTMKEIADAENVKPSYVIRAVRQTLLSPEIVEAILAGRNPEGLTMAREMQPFPIEWVRQTFQLSASHQAVPMAALQTPAASDFHAAFPVVACFRQTLSAFCKTPALEHSNNA